MKKVIEGSHAVSEAARLAKVQVIAAYPITPQTHIVEALSEYCSDGTLDAPGAHFLLIDYIRFDGRLNRMLRGFVSRGIVADVENRLRFFQAHVDRARG